MECMCIHNWFHKLLPLTALRCSRNVQTVKITWQANNGARTLRVFMSQNIINFDSNGLPESNVKKSLPLVNLENSDPPPLASRNTPKVATLPKVASPAPCQLHLPAKKMRPKVIYFSSNTDWVNRKMNFSSYSNSGLFVPFSINRKTGNNGHVSASKRTSKFSWFPHAVKEFRERENQKQRFLFSIILLC